MPSIAALIKELLSEDKYSSNFTDKIEDRVKQLNVAQLQGIYGHLLKSAKESKTNLWKGANEELMSRIQGELQIKTKQAQAEHKVVEEYRFQQKQKREKLKMAKKEQIRVKEMIEAKARKQAEQEVKEKEYQRQSEERMVIMRRVFEAEELRNTWWKRIAVMYLIFTAAIIVVISVILKLAIYFTICGIFFITVIAAYAAYHCHQWTIIKPIQIAPEIIEAQIEQREDVLKKEAFSAIREKERKFQEQERLDKIERKRRKRHKKEQEALQAKLLEQARLERIAMAKEIIERERSSQGGGSSIAGSAANSIQGSLVGTIDPSKHRPSLTTLKEEDHKNLENMVIDLEAGSPSKEDHPEVDEEVDDGEHYMDSHDEEKDAFDDHEDFDEGSDTENDSEDDQVDGNGNRERDDIMPSIRHHRGSKNGISDIGEGKHDDDVISIFTSSVADENVEFNKIYRDMQFDPEEHLLSPLPKSPRPNTLIAEHDDDVLNFDIESGVRVKPK